MKTRINWTNALLDGLSAGLLASAFWLLGFTGTWQTVAAIMLVLWAMKVAAAPR